MYGVKRARQMVYYGHQTNAWTLIQDEKSNDVLSIRTIISQKCQFAQGWGDNALILIQIAMILKRTLIVRWKNLDWIGSIGLGPGNIFFFGMISYDFLLNQLKFL